MTNLLESVEAPTEGVHCAQHAVELYQESTHIDTGALYITESCVVWQGASRSFNLPYLKISLHAVSKDPTSFPHEHLLLMLDDFSLSTNGEVEAGSGDEEDGEVEGSPTILRLVPVNTAVLSEMYKAMTDCQVLNPDPDAEADSDYAGEDDEDEDYDEEFNANHTNGSHDVGPAGDDEAMDEDQFAD